MKVQQFLDERGIPFEGFRTSPRLGPGMAQAVHVCGDSVAKTVLLKADGHFIWRSCRRRIKSTWRSREALAAHSVELASERELGQVFPDCEVGALPPFGSQYGIETLVDASLTEDNVIVLGQRRIDQRLDAVLRAKRRQCADLAIGKNLA